MTADAIDRMTADWARSVPGLDVSVLQVIGRLLRGAEHVQVALRAALDPLGLSYADFDVLNTLRRRADPDGTHPRALADSLLISSGAMTARLDRLDAAGLTRRTTDPADGRGRLVSLTDAGEKLAARALDAVLATDDRLLRSLDPAARRSLADALRPLLADWEHPSP